MAGLRRKRPRGAALVEMAIVLPLLVLLIFGLIEYGWMFAKLAQVNNATRHGARIAVRPLATDSEVKNAVGQLMTQAGMGASGYTVTITNLSTAKGNPVTVAVSVSYTKVTLTHFSILPVPQALTGRSTMAKEAP